MSVDHTAPPPRRANVFLSLGLFFGVDDKTTKGRMRITDQPGRILAVTVVTPTLLYLSFRLRRPRCDETCRRAVAEAIAAFAAVLFVYEMFWICAARPPKVAYV